MAAAVGQGFPTTTTTTSSTGSTRNDGSHDNTAGANERAPSIVYRNNMVFRRDPSTPSMTAHLNIQPSNVVDRKSMILVRRTSTSNMAVPALTTTPGRKDDNDNEEEYSEEMVEVEEVVENDVDSALLTGGPSFEPAYEMVDSSDDDDDNEQVVGEEEYYEEEVIDEQDELPSLQVMITGRIAPFMSPLSIQWQFVFQDNTSQPLPFWKESLHNSTMNALMESFPETTATRHVMHLLKSLPIYITLKSKLAPNPLADQSDNPLPLQDYCQSLRDHPNALQESAQQFLSEYSETQNTDNDDCMCLIYDGSILHTHPDWKKNTLDPSWVAISPFAAKTTTTSTTNKNTAASADGASPMSMLHIPAGEQGDVSMLEVLHDVATYLTDEDSGSDSESGDSDDEMDNPHDGDGAVCLDVTDETEHDVTERLHGALHLALDVWEQHATTSFLEPNPWEGIDRPGFSPRSPSHYDDKKNKKRREKKKIENADRTVGADTGAEMSEVDRGIADSPLPFGEGLDWAVRASMNYIYRRNYCVPPLVSYQAGFVEEDLSRAMDNKPSAMTLSELHGSGLLRQYDLESHIDSSQEEGQINAIPNEKEIESTDTEGFYTDKQRDSSNHATPLESNLTDGSSENNSSSPLCPLDSNRLEQALPSDSTASNSPQTDNENDEHTTKFYRQVMEDPSNADERKQSIPEHEKETPKHTKESFETDLQEDDKADEILENAEQSEETTTPSLDSNWRREVAHHNWRDMNSYNKPTTPAAIQEEPAASLKSSRNKVHSTTVQPFDIEAQQEYDAVQAAAEVSALNATDFELSPAWQAFILEEQKERERLVNALRTIRIVLLTLLVVLPFGLGLYFTIKTETED